MSITSDFPRARLYFTDFAKAALRAMQRDSVTAARPSKSRFETFQEPFQTLEFLVRDWPHFEVRFKAKEGLMTSLVRRTAARKRLDR